MPRRKLFVGETVARLRARAGLTQAELARRLGLSPSYVNQIERNQRPLTSAVLLDLMRTFRVDVAAFSEESHDRLLAELREALADPALGAEDLPVAEIKTLAQGAPGAARALVRLQAAHRALLGQAGALDDALGAGDGGRAGQPWEEVRDFFHRIDNYLDPLDRQAEATARTLGPTPEARVAGLAERLERGHGLRVVLDRDGSGPRPLRVADRAAGLLVLDGFAARETAAFAMGVQLALLEARETIDATIAGAGFRSPDAGEVCRLALANHFAGALALPYAEFHAEAQRRRHDLSLLTAAFGASLEQVCHRLSTLQRPGHEGVPFYFLRVDRAGNITKRHSATRLQFARHGGACPLWNVHEAFETPDRTLVQLAEMPDGVRYLSLAFGVTKGGAGHAQPARRYALGLGCEAAFADRVVYADGLDLRGSATPIGVSCRLCERAACAQRAFPPLGRRLRLDPDRRDAVPYGLAPPPGTGP